MLIDTTEVNFENHVSDLARAYPFDLIKAEIRQHSEDFKVTEILSFEPSGSGEHLFLQIEKKDCNTQWVIRHLQKTFNLSSKEIGYAGKKDRYSLSTQWFSLHLAGKDVDPLLLETSQLKLINSQRHNKKLRVGSIKENQFQLVLRNLSASLDQKYIEAIISRGIPNYFGDQRFGHQSKNLCLADKLFKQQIKIKNRDKRGMAISSARSYLFNLILSQRVKDRSWDQMVAGDALNLVGSHSFFIEPEASSQQQLRIDQGDLHICGPLIGTQVSNSSAAAKAIEESVITPYSHWQEALQRLSIDTQMRAFRCLPRKLSYRQQATQAELSFSLDSGCYATSVLRELFDFTDVARQKVQIEYAQNIARNN